MAKEFQRLSEVTIVEEIKDTSTVLVEVDGEIYRAPKNQVGGAGSVKIAIIRDSGYLNAIAGLSTMVTNVPAPTYKCINMTFEEAYETMLNGEPLMAIGMMTTEGASCIYGEPTFAGTVMGVQCILIMFHCNLTGGTIGLYWTSSGLSTENPFGEA